MDMVALAAAVWILYVDAGPQDDKPIRQVIEDKAGVVEGTGGECRYSAVSPQGERKVICRLGQTFSGISLTCKPGDRRDAQFFILSDDDMFRVRVSCEPHTGIPASTR